MLALDVLFFKILVVSNFGNGITLVFRSAMDTFMDEKQLLKKIKKFVKKRYSDEQYVKLKFHNFKRCKQIIRWAHIIAEPFNLAPADQFALYAALWLKDIGYTEDPTAPETAGLRVAVNFLQQLKLMDNVIERITDLWICTSTPAQPLSLLSEIFLDAETYYLGEKSFKQANDLKRKEQAELQFRKISKAEWSKQSVELLEHHRYHTATARDLLEIKKLRNLSLLRCELQEIDHEKHESDSNELNNPPAVLISKNKNFPEKGVDTLFRVSLANNQRISGLADNKARILITVNSIILSAIISLILKRLDKEAHLLYPTLTLVAVSLVSITLAILAIRPHRSSGKFTREALENNEANLLFYGNFNRMDLSDFRASMFHMMNYKELVYGALVQDLYEQGRSIGRKYFLLRVSYTIFMFGLIVSILAFIATTVSHHPNWSSSIF